MLKQTVSSKIKSFTRTAFELQSSRLKKILFATGFLVLGMCSVGNVVHAAPQITGIERGEYDEKVRVEVKIKESEEGYKIDKLYYKVGEGKEILLQDDNIINSKSNVAETEMLVAVEFPANIINVENLSLIAKSKNDQEAEKASEPFSIIDIEDEEDNHGPRVVEGTLLKYHSEKYGDYIQAQFINEDNNHNELSRIWKITDENGENAVILNEKEQATKVTVKYILPENQAKFRVYDIVGHFKEIDISDAVEVTFNARTRDGSRFVLGVSETIGTGDNEYKLDSIKTGSNQVIDYHSGNDMYGKQIANDNEDADLEEIVGVTKLVLTYKKVSGDGTKTIYLPLILDKTTPEVVGYIAIPEGDGTYTIKKVEANVRNIVTNTSEVTTFRAYVNNTTDRCIVEVRDVQSGIDTIKLLKGSPGGYKEIEGEVAQKAAYDSHGRLIPSVLHLFKFEGLKDRVTAVRVTDGLGNVYDLPVSNSTVENNDTIIFANLEEYTDEHGHAAYRVVAQDYKAGLWKIERDTEDENVKQVLVNFGSPNHEDIVVEKLEDGVPTPVAKEDIKELLEIAGVEYNDNLYKQYILERVARNITQQGQPIIMVYDALGNARQISFDDVAFACYYATYNQKGSLAVNLKETRGIWKVTVGIVSPEDAANEPKYNGEVPVFSNEPKYEGEIASEENTPKIIKPDGTLEPPNNGIAEGEICYEGKEDFITDPGSENCPEGYDPEKDNRPKYMGEVPSEANQPKYNEETPSLANEPKYNGLVPSSSNEPKYTKPDGTKVVASAENEPKYREIIPVVIEPTPNPLPEGWTEIKEMYDSLEVSQKAEYNEVLEEHNKWEKAMNDHNTWSTAKEAHNEWQAKMDDYNEWQDALADYNEWKAVVGQYQEWSTAKEAHNEWQEQKRLHTEWEKLITTYTLEVFREGNEPEKIIKTYQVPDGVVQNIVIYHTRGKSGFIDEITSVEHNNVAGLQDVSELGNDEIVTTKQEYITKNGTGIEKVLVEAKRGIKLVEYADKTVVEFNKDLPTELCVNCCINDQFQEVKVTDSVGCQLKISQNEVNLYKYNYGMEMTSYRTIQPS